jgi:O-antigen biosynthesis protein WbqP
VLKGDMSLVGPRPALFNQDDLVALRTAAGVEALRPGLTGWAQVNGRDELPIPEKVTLDVEYLRRRSFWLDLKIIGLTLAGLLGAKGVSH